MTWQDELRRLESDLAAGRVSAQDYRIRRDQLLTSAAAPQPEAPDQQQPPADSTQIIPKVTDADATQAVQRPRQREIPRGGNFPQHGAAQQQAPGGHQGYVQQGGGQQGYGQQGQQAQQSGAEQDPERTQTVPPGARAQQQQQEDPPPWAGNEFPSVATGSSEWVKQGPEAFGDDGKSARGKVFAVVGGVVLVALLAVGAFLLFGMDSGGGKGPRPQAAGGGGDRNNNQQVKPKRDALGIVDPPGAKEDHSETKDLAGLKAANYLTPAEYQAYTNAVTTKVVYKVGKDNGVTTAMVGAKASSPSSARAAAKALNEAQLNSGMSASPNDQPDGVYVAEVRKSGQPIEMRAHYAHGTTIVRVHVAGSDYQAVKRDFDKALGDELKSLSADG